MPQGFFRLFFLLVALSLSGCAGFYHAIGMSTAGDVDVASEVSKKIRTSVSYERAKREMELKYGGYFTVYTIKRSRVWIFVAHRRLVNGVEVSHTDTSDPLVKGLIYESVKLARTVKTDSDFIEVYCAVNGEDVLCAIAGFSESDPVVYVNTCASAK